MKRNDAIRSAMGDQPSIITDAMLASTTGGAGGQAPKEDAAAEDTGAGLDKKTAGPTGMLYQKWGETFGVQHPNARHKPTIFERMAPPPAAEQQTTQASE
jgi:hypothetical protein